MANRISFIIIAKDAFSKVGRRVIKTSKRMLVGFKNLAFSAVRLSFNIAGLIASFGGMLSMGRMFKKGMGFEDSLADLSAITGAAGNDLKYLSEQGLSLSKSSVISAGEVVESFKLIASAKDELLEDPKALVAVTKQVLLLSNASGVDLATSANTVTRSLNQFGKGAEFAAKYVDILAAGAKYGSSEIADTGAAVILAGPNARAAGLDFLSLNAALQATAKGGILGARAGTALSTIFSRLRRQSYDFTKLGLVGVFEKIKKKLDKINSSTRRARLEAKLFGDEHAKVGIALLNNIDVMRRMEARLKESGVASEQAAIRMATFSYKVKLLGIMVDEKLIQTFVRLEKQDVFSNMAQDFMGWLDTINSSDIETFAETIKSIAESMAVIIKGAAALGKYLFTEGYQAEGTGKRGVRGRGALEPMRMADVLEGEGTYGKKKGVRGYRKVEAIRVEIDVPYIAPLKIDMPYIKPIKIEMPDIPQLKVAINTPEFMYKIREMTSQEPPQIAAVRQAVAPEAHAVVDINLKSPAGVVESMRSVAMTPNLRVGTNMETTA